MQQAILISEKDQFDLLPSGCIKVLVTADIETIKQRFAMRTGGKLAPPIATMLERKHNMFDNIECNLHIVSGIDDVDVACTKICSLIK